MNYKILILSLMTMMGPTLKAQLCSNQFGDNQKQICIEGSGGSGGQEGGNCHEAIEVAKMNAIEEAKLICANRIKLQGWFHQKCFRPTMNGNPADYVNASIEGAFECL